MKLKLYIILLIALMLYLPSDAYCQKMLKIESLTKPGRVIEIKEGNRVSVRYIDSTKKRGFTPILYLGKKLHFLYGRVISIEDSVIQVRKSSLKPRIITVPIDSIAQIRKDKLGWQLLYAFGISAPVVPIYLSTTANPLLILLSASIVTSVTGEKLVFPLKNVDEGHFRKNNQWRLEVVEIE